MITWHTLLCLSLLTANRDSSKCTSKNLREKESRGIKDVFEDGSILDYLRQELSLNVTPKDQDIILQQTKWFE